MRIAEVLAQKAPGAVTLWPNHTLDDAVRLCDERHIASVVIVDPERRPLGIVTDRQIIRALARHGASALQLSVTQIMLSPPPACTCDSRVADAMHRMTADRVRHLVVMNGEELAGIVSIGDLVKVRLDEAEIEGRVLRERALGRIAAE